MIPILKRNRQILQMRKEGVRCVDVARKFKLSPSRIHLIERRDAADRSMAERRSKLRDEIRTAEGILYEHGPDPHSIRLAVRAKREAARAPFIRIHHPAALPILKDQGNCRVTDAGEISSSMPAFILAGQPFPDSLQVLFPTRQSLNLDQNVGAHEVQEFQRQALFRGLHG